MYTKRLGQVHTVQVVLDLIPAQKLTLTSTVIYMNLLSGF